jgi:hypothetical protein
MTRQKQPIRDYRLLHKRSSNATSRRRKLPTRLVGTLAVGVTLVVGTVGLLANNALTVRADQPVGLHTGTDNTGQYWTNPDTAFTAQHTALTNSQSIYIGDTVQMANDLSLQVTQVERNWEPAAAVASSYGRNHDGDDPEGREIILVWFTATNHGTTAIAYNDSQWTLLRPGKSEQRVARLASLLPTAYGDDGVEPWLLPGESKSTFVPFLVTPGEAVTSFQYYMPQPQAANATKPVGQTTRATLARLSVQLRAPLAALATARSVVFTGDITITVGP